MQYNSFVDFFKERYGARLQKVVVNGGFTCPNRDGSLGLHGGCTFCNNDAFHPGYSTPSKPLWQQIDEGVEFHKVRYRKAQRYIAYFQPFSNTYAPLSHLRVLYEEALSHPLIEGIVVGTRPDCVDAEKLDYLRELSENKIVIIEYGIESCYNATLEKINRGHDFACAARAIEATAKRGIVQCGHFIFGLPGENLQMMADQARIINELPLTAVKFHQLQIIKGTRMEQQWRANLVNLYGEAVVAKMEAGESEPPSQNAQLGEFFNFTLDGYMAFIADFLKRLRPSLYIDRFAGEVPPRYLSPLQKGWGLIRYQELISILHKIE